MPKDTIERAIKKAGRRRSGENYDEVRYEGYGPGGVAVIVEALTDNRNRTASRRPLRLHQAWRRAGRDQLGQLHVRPAGRDPLSRRRRQRRCHAGSRHRGRRRQCREQRRGHEITGAIESFFAMQRVAWRHASVRPKAPSSTGGRAPRFRSMRRPRPPCSSCSISSTSIDDVQNVYANFDMPDAVLQKLSG